MKILAISDEECASLWEYYTRDKLAEYDMIISCGDLNSAYLSFLVTMTGKPVLYVHGNHDAGYFKKPPEGCDCIDDHFVIYNGIRILGLGGCLRYHDGPFHYTEREMRKRIRKLRYWLWRYKGVDIVVTHCPPKGLGDLPDNAHQGFQAFVDLLDKYHPQYLLHGHVHLSYGSSKNRMIPYGDTKILNVSERCPFEIEDRPTEEKYKNRLIYKTHFRDPYENHS